MSRLNRVLTEAHARLGEVLNRVDSAHQAMSDQAPGYPSSTIGGRGSRADTQPERLHATLARDPAHGARHRLQELVRRIARDSDELYDLTVTWGTRRVPLADGPEEGWCVSCFRDNGYHEPIAEGVYRDWCRWCGDWRGANLDDKGNPTNPPIELIRMRHEGRRVTTADVERARKSA